MAINFLIDYLTGQLAMVMNPTAIVATTGSLLLETSSYLLLESGDRLLLE